MQSITREMALLVPIVGIGLALLAGMYLVFRRVLNQPTGNAEQIEIAQNIEDGARAFLHREYVFLAIFVFIMQFVVGAAAGLENNAYLKSGGAFLLGAVLSAVCGYLGMSIAVKANVRTTEAAKTGLGEALKVAFSSGAVMGLSVVAFGMLGIVVLYGALGGITSSETSYLAGLGFGASSIALFARVGGGIYTKAADVGADLVGKVEASIPEDDPRNPATIADNVGDNVGDVAGMGADLFESFIGSIIAAIQLASNDISTEDLSPDQTPNDMISLRIAFPLWIAGFGIVASVVGVFFVRISNEQSDEDDLQEKLLGAIRRGIFLAAFLAAGLSLVASGLLFGFSTPLCYKLWGCVLVGLVAGMLIGVSTEYCTSFTYKPTISIAKKTRLGPSAVIIQGLGIGMLSTMFPVLLIFAALLAATQLAQVYGIAVAAVGMLSTLGVTLATDAFGPVVDNAGGIAEMAHLDEEVRERTDALDALGNTTAATGKGFAIGSAVLTALALLSSFASETELTSVDIMNPVVLSGAIFGACLPYIFAALTMMAVARSAGVIIQEVRRQFAEYPGILQGTQKADFARCVAISTESSLIEMVIPGLLAIVAPIFIGFLLGPLGLVGMLVGGILAGFVQAVSMANSGGAWDNAKKFIEAEGMGAQSENKAKGSDYHKAAVVGDTVGDPFKDTSGPALNILIKLMSIISLVFAPVFKGKQPYEYWWIALIIGSVFMVFVTAYVLEMRRRGVGKVDFSSGPQVFAAQNPTKLHPDIESVSPTADPDYQQQTEIELQGN